MMDLWKKAMKHGKGVEYCWYEGLIAYVKSK